MRFSLKLACSFSCIINSMVEIEKNRRASYTRIIIFFCKARYSSFIMKLWTDKRYKNKMFSIAHEKDDQKKRNTYLWYFIGSYFLCWVYTCTLLLSIYTNKASSLLRAKHCVYILYMLAHNNLTFILMMEMNKKAYIIYIWAICIIAFLFIYKPRNSSRLSIISNTTL